MRPVVAIAAVVVIVGALFYLKRHAPAERTVTASAPSLPPSAGEPPRATPPFVTRAPEPAAPAPTPNAPAPQQNGAPAPQVKQALDAARAAMIAAAAHACRPQSRDAEQHLRFRYELQISNGAARASGVEKLESDVADQHVLECLLTSLGNARWTYAGPDLVLTAEEDWPLGMIH